jgi:hypothetical protein
VAGIKNRKIVIDDQELSAWRQFVVLHPSNVPGKSVEEYRKFLAKIGNPQT